MVNAAELSKLRDIHLPPPINLWPLAPGWYVVITVIFILCIGIIILLHHRIFHKRPIRQAQRCLKIYQEHFQQNANSQYACACISELLKRVALVYYPRSDVACLHGEAWLLFLNNTSNRLDFKQVRIQLLNLPYQLPQTRDLHLLFTMAHAWIKQQGKRCSH